MLPLWIYNLSVPVLLILVIVVSWVLSFTTLAIVRRFGKSWSFGEESDFGEIFYDAIGVIIALMLAFVTVAVWESFSKTSDLVEAEANAMNDVYRDLETFPSSFRDETRELIRDYTKDLISKEWPGLIYEGENKAVHAKLLKIQSRIFHYKPTDMGEQAVFADLIRLFDQYRSCRRSRYLEVNNHLEFSMWLALIIGSGINIAFGCLFNAQHIHRQILSIGTLATVKALLFFLLIAHDRPFTPLGGVGPEPFSLLLETWNEPGESK